MIALCHSRAGACRRITIHVRHVGGQSGIRIVDHGVLEASSSLVEFRFQIDTGVRFSAGHEPATAAKKSQLGIRIKSAESGPFTHEQVLARYPVAVERVGIADHAPDFPRPVRAWSATPARFDRES